MNVINILAWLGLYMFDDLVKKNWKETIAQIIMMICAHMRNISIIYILSAVTLAG